ncbi:MAG: hypothetical protein KKG47_00445 [Proteobacteria bacterium]|nr:hypothetical protein [Pseudomonadota bacterium]MBU1737207.1 hypothetical protein [Pseudomonadota bacterium]
MISAARSVKKSFLLDLFHQCPRGSNTVNQGCPLFNVRKLTPENKAIYIEKLSDLQMNNIIEHHLHCVSKPD